MAFPQKILVRGPNWIGDQIMAAAFFAKLRAAFPAARITLLCPAEVAGVADPRWFDEVVPLSRAQRKLPTAWGYWSRVVAARRAELAITLASSLSAAVLLRVAGIPRRIGFADPGAKWFLSVSTRWEGRSSGKHKGQLYEDLFSLVAKEFGVPVPTAAVENAVFSKVDPSAAIVLAPGASISLREWPGFVELARRLRQIYPQSPVRVVGSEAQAAWGPHFEALGDPAVENWIGLTTLPELVQLCRESRWVVANDSGVAHVAATLAGAPTVVVFGPGDPAYVLPRGGRVRVARNASVPCSPCEKPRCHARYGYKQCLRVLSVDSVLAEISTLH